MSIVSVIVPVYNVAEYLRPCIESILKQTFVNYELILVDDGSTDKSGIICDEYAEKDNRIFVIHQKNGGLSAARNTGIDSMHGQFVTFIDSDDIVSKCYLEVLYNDIRRANAQIAICQMEFIENSNFLNEKEEICEPLVMSGRDAVLNMYMEEAGIKVNACAKLYCSSLFSKLRFPVGKIHEDQARVPMLLFTAEKVVINSAQLYGYRLRTDSIVHRKFSVKRYDDIEAIDDCITFFEKNQEEMIVKAAKKCKDKLLAVYTLYARKDNVYKEVPKKYRMSEFRALQYLYNNMSNDRYTYELAKYHPNWLLPHAYLRKIKKIFGLKVPE